MLQELEEHITTLLSSRKQPQHNLDSWKARFAVTQVQYVCNVYYTPIMTDACANTRGLRMYITFHFHRKHFAHKNLFLA